VSENPDDSDVGLETGTIIVSGMGSAAPGSVRPGLLGLLQGTSRARGLLKATSEFVPLLNTYYNAWALARKNRRQRMFLPQRQQPRLKVDRYQTPPVSRRIFKGV